MKCPRCQQENPLPDAQFCPRCGAPVTRAEDSSPPAVTFADLQRALREALEQQTATSEILRVIASLGRTGATVLPGFGPRYDDFCQLMVHLLAEPNGTAAEAPDSTRRESLMGFCTEWRQARAIAGGSDGGGWIKPVASARGPPRN